METKYKLESFENPNFPVYSSAQTRDGVLVIPHFHKAAELNIIMSGKVEVIIDTVQIECTKGDMIFIPPYSFHSVRSINGEASIKGVVFELDLININLSGIKLDEILNKEIINDFVIDKKCSFYAQLSEAFLDAVKMYHLDEYSAKIELLSQLYAITALLIKRYGYLADSDKTAMYKRIKPVIEYINKNYDKKIYISDLSKILNVCDDHLIRIFKSVLNQSPKQYITDKRVEEAMKLIINTELPMYEIAEKVGFANANYMASVFRSTIYMTPMKYRELTKQ